MKRSIFCYAQHVHTDLHDEMLVFPNAQQERLLVAQLTQGTVHCLEVDDTLWIMLDNALKPLSEVHQVQHVHLPELFAQVRTKCDAQSLKSKRA